MKKKSLEDVIERTSSQNLENSIQDLNYQNQLLGQKIDESLQVFANMQFMLNALTQHVNSQVMVMNQMSQQINHLTLKLTDMEIDSQNNDSSLSEIADNQRSMINQIEELKMAVENIRLSMTYSYE